MHKDVLEILQLYQKTGANNILSVLDHPSAVAFLKKIKVYQKAASISLQQVDRFAQLYNKFMDMVKMNKFYFTISQF
jgi:hypothetical protein